MAEMSGRDRHDNVWVDFSVDFSKWKGWAVMLVSLNMMVFRLLWNWSLESLVGLLTDSMRPHTVCRLFHFKNRPLNLSKSEQFASPQGKLLPYLKTLFTMFLVLLAQFSQIISGEKHSLSSFTPTRISKFHASWRLTCMQTRNFKRFSKHIIQELLLSILERYTPGKQFSLRSGHLYFYTIQSLRTVYFSVLSNNLSNWCHEQYFFAPTLYKKNSIFCRWNKSTHDFIPHLFVSVFSRFGAHSPVHLWQV